MTESLTRGKALIEHIRKGWELWHISDSPLPGRWELRRARERISVHWDAIEGVRRRYLPEMRTLTDERQEGRYTFAYVPKQRALAGGAVL